jgi:transcriptional regulator with XRE-family HTH domain
MSSIAEKVEKKRKEIGLTKKTLYEGMGVTPQGYDAMIKNDSISAQNIQKISNIFGVSVSYFYDTIDEPKIQRASFADEIISELRKQVEDLKRDKEFFKSLLLGKLEQIDEKLGKSKPVSESLRVA